LGNGITRIQSYTFAQCRSLTTVTIPNSVTSIDTNAFNLCTGLKTLTIGSGVTNIGNFAFNSCTNLTAVTFPASIASINIGAFNGCSNAPYLGSYQFIGEPAGAVVYFYHGTTGWGETYGGLPTVELSAPPQIGMPLSETNLIVVRVGNGTQVLTNTGNSFFLDEYTASGNYVGTISVPDSGANGMVLSGTSFEQGFLTRSADEHFLCLAAYGAAVGGTNNLDSSSGGVVPRVAVTFDAFGNVQRPVITSTKFSGLSWRSAATDGTNNFWGTGSSGGVMYLGNASPAAVLENTKANCRVVGIFNGSLYVSSAAINQGDDLAGLYPFNGLPKSSVGLPVPIIFTNTFTTLSGIADFAVSPTGTTIYFADERAPNGVQGGIQRWDLNTGSWNNTYNLTNGLNNLGTAHLAVDWSGANPVLYATTLTNSDFANVPNLLVRVRDTGRDSLFTTLAASGANQVFRGVKFGPKALPPQIGSNAGVQDDKFWFVVSGVANQTIIVEASTNLINWQPIWTNTLSGTNAVFIDQQWTNYPNRFYRAR
jgi:hypothetical protein